MTSLLINRQTLQKKNKTPPTHKKNLNFYATVQVAHLLLPPLTSPTQGKSKRAASPTLYSLHLNFSIS